MSKIPVWQMVKEAVIAIGSNTIANADIKKYILDHYGAVNEGTINAQITVCSVNRQSRINFPENHSPRIANSQYDFLFNVDRGLVTLYNPDKHGKWEIAAQGGKLIVKKCDDNRKTNIPTTPDHTPVFRTIHHKRTRSDIERPNCEAVKRYLEKWETLENYRAQESALNKLFWEVCPLNNNLDDVLLKVATLNTFYSTNIYNVFAVARHIVSLDIDERLERGDDSLVTDIASGHGITNNKSGKEIHFFSFATKYCSHHRPQIYPIYDSYVEELLIYLRDADGFSNFRSEALRNISLFKETLLKLQKFYSLESFSLKEIDQYLWQYGKEKFPNTYGHKQNNNT
jgi:hypothetical protein